MIREILNTEIKAAENDGIEITILKSYTVKNKVEVPFEVLNFSVLLIKSGKLKIKFSSESKIIKRKDLLLIPVNSLCTQLEATEDIQIYIIRTGFDFAFNNCYQTELADAFSFLMLQTNHKITLNENDFRILSMIYRLMHILQNSLEKPEVLNELRRICFNLFIFELKFIYSKYAPEISLDFSRKESIIIHFLTVLAIHIRTQHHVKFYAASLFMTPGHLNRMVKEVTGRSAKAFVIDALVDVSKNLLGETNYSVARIADELEFSSAANFGAFFKRHTGLLPIEYRMNKI